jgi:LL-diaminopimelate aminotransferase
VITREFTVAQRLSELPPYLFVEIDRKKREAAARGVDVVNLGIGDPDLPTPAPIVRALARAARNPVNHRYPESEGLDTFRAAAAEWYQNRFGANVSSATEVLSLIGAKEGIGHLPLALVNPGDVVLIPDPAYPVYRAGTVFAGGVPYVMPLRRENGFLPDLDAIPDEVRRRARLMFINYPNNPTGAVAPLSFYEEVVRFADRHNIIVAQDNTYSEVAFDGYRPASLLQVDGAIDVGIEFHSLSKTFNMTGWRIGFVVGNARVVDALRRIKSNLDSGAFQAVQEAGISALAIADQVSARNSRIYRRRRDILVKGLRQAGLDVETPRATFYVWPRVPKGYDSAGFVSTLIEQAGVACIPGNGFGKEGEGYARFALTADASRLQEACERLANTLRK